LTGQFVAVQITQSMSNSLRGRLPAGTVIETESANA